MWSVCVSWRTKSLHERNATLFQKLRLHNQHQRDRNITESYGEVFSRVQIDHQQGRRQPVTARASVRTHIPQHLIGHRDALSQASIINSKCRKQQQTMRSAIPDPASPEWRTEKATPVLGAVFLSVLLQVQTTAAMKQNWVSFEVGVKENQICFVLIGLRTIYKAFIMLLKENLLNDVTRGCKNLLKKTEMLCTLN